jgi:effector-binding domain-containing protein
LAWWNEFLSGEPIGRFKMIREVEVREVAPQTLAVVRGRANAGNVGARIGEYLSEVWAFLKASGLKPAEVEHSGHNVVIYLNQEGKSLLFTDEGVPIEAGVQMAAPFEGRGRVVCSASPGGTAATVTYFGPYEKLAEAHKAIRAWCKEDGRVLAGPVWEVYGHWTDKPSELRTDVFYLLK